MGKSNRIGYKQLALMAIMIICIVFGTAQYVKAENEVSFNYSYSSERDTAIYDIRNSYLPLMFPGLSGSEIKTIQITILVHFTDGDYYFDNSTEKFRSAGDSSGNSSSTSSSSSKTLSAPKSFKATLQKYNQVVLSWKKVSGAKSYNVYRKVGSGKYKKIKNLKKTTYTDKKLKIESKISYYVVAVNSSKKEGKKSAKKTVTTIGTVVGIKVKKQGTYAVVLWKKMNGASGYQISASSIKGKMKNSATATASELEKVLSIETGKKMFYRVRAFQKVGNKKVYGPWSKEISYSIPKPSEVPSQNTDSNQRTTSDTEVKVPNTQLEVSNILIPVSFTGFGDFNAANIDADKADSSNKGEAAVKISYSDAYFSIPARHDNNRLVSLSAFACASTYASGQTEKILDQCGFNNIVPGITGKSKEQVETNDNCSYWFANKRIKSLNGEEFCIVAVIINGYTDEGLEWVSNFNLGRGIIHRGFKKAADLVYSKLMDYLSTNAKSIKKENVKIWLTGHSRGAAIANLVGIELANPISFEDKTAGTFYQDNVYVYGFATPRYLRAGPTNNFYNYIHNYYVSGDMVPELAPTKWDYRRCGLEKELEITSLVKSIFATLVGRDYKGLSVSKRNEIINAFCDFGGSADKYETTKYACKAYLVDPIYMTPTNLFTITAAEFAQKGIGLAMAESYIKHKFSGGITILKAYILEDKKGSNLTSLLISNLTGIKQAHLMGTYLICANTIFGGISVSTFK